MAEKTKVLIMGAAGRDFHNFNTYFRDNEAYRSWPSPPPRSRTSTTASTPPSWPAGLPPGHPHPR